MLRSYLLEAAGVLLTRVPKWSAVKAWGLGSPSATGSARQRLRSRVSSRSFHAVAPLALRPTWRQLDWDMLRGGRRNWASISGSVALERFQNEKKLLSKHGRNLAVTVSPFVEMDHWEFNHLYEIAALDFADQD
jgi:hypothetical protein